ncbi:hypothetical protein B7C51_04965 [Paenibacillus larvae subsp. pulvifaciens]|uniref:Uncharacterized protein n=1 Tax=Paenibacillus larvae subsp. pulvifaciens TaxID=1477 RepID=A0A1V0UQA7_9BACL|nr:hypothetical protein [Paenibacillus larvae]ARF67321.1 hypothetical protein B7C51_04965 [Paenibacillus larvae subsp. pulvifaciens]
MKTRTYRGYKIKPVQQGEVVIYKVFSAEEWEEPYRSSEWDACSLLEVKDYINSQFTDNPVTEENYLNYCTITGFELIMNG